MLLFLLYKMARIVCVLHFSLLSGFSSLGFWSEVLGIKNISLKASEKKTENRERAFSSHWKSSNAFLDNLTFVYFLKFFCLLLRLSFRSHPRQHCLASARIYSPLPSVPAMIESIVLLHPCDSRLSLCMYSKWKRQTMWIIYFALEITFLNNWSRSSFHENWQLRKPFFFCLFANCWTVFFYCVSSLLQSKIINTSD